MTTGPDDKSTATIKFGDKFDAPWYVVSGNPASQRRQLVEFCGMEDNPELTLLELMVLISAEAQAKWAVRSKLGGMPSSTEIDVPQKRTVDKVNEAKAEGSKPGPTAFIYDLIKGAEDKKALTKVFMSNKDAFNGDKALQAAFNERKSALS